MKRQTAFLLWITIYIMFWLIVNEKTTIEVLILGVIISFAAFLFNYSNHIRFGERAFKWKRLGIYALYLAILLKEIVIANISVAFLLIKPKLNIDPCIVKYKTKLKQDMNKVILANSITLTPGTVTVTLEGDELTVHCLMDSYVPGLIDSKLEKLLLKLEE